MDKTNWIKCTGEAHNNGFIDNCAVCMPFWGKYPVCPKHDKKLTEHGYCKVCKKYYDIKR